MSANDSHSSMDTATENPANRPIIASIRSRLLAMIYDGLIIFFISAITIFLIQLIFIGSEHLPPDHVLTILLKPMWFVPGFFYLSHYWRRSGQTPSMKVWKIKLITKQGDNISWLHALLRYVFSLLGFGLLFSLFNKHKSSLQDSMSGTLIIQTI